MVKKHQEARTIASAIPSELSFFELGCIKVRFATNVRKSKVTAKVVVCQLRVIQPEQCQESTRADRLNEPDYRPP